MYRLIIIFFYLFSVPLVFMPTTLYIYGVGGLILISVGIVLYKKTNLYLLNIWKFLIPIICAFFLLLFFSFIINDSFDKLAITKYVCVPYIIYPLAACFVVFILPDTMSLREFFKTIVCVTTIQLFITLVAFFNQSFMDFLISVQDLGEFKEITNRAIGLGFGFDHGVMIISYSMLIIIYLYLSSNYKIIYLLLFSFHVVVGFFVARTMFISLIISLVFLLFYPSNNLSNKNKFKTKIYFFLFISVIAILYFSFFNSYLQNTKQNFTNWILSLFITENIENSSPGVLLKMYYFPSDFKTWIIGDGLFFIDGNTRHFYGETDSGYMRTLLLIGIPGIFIYLLFNIILFIKLRINDKKLSFLFFFFMMMNLIFFIKLVATPFYLFAFLLIGYYEKQKYKNIIRVN